MFFDKNNLTNLSSFSELLSSARLRGSPWKDPSFAFQAILHSRQARRSHHAVDFSQPLASEYQDKKRKRNSALASS